VNLGAFSSGLLTGLREGVEAALIVAILLFQTVGGLQEPYEQIFEGITMLVAAGVVTWMLFWMRRQAMSVKGELQAAVDRALTAGGIWGLALLAFTAVIREGIETSLFLVGQADSADEGASSVLVGALVGLAIAVAIGYVFYRGTRRINLGSFFRWTGVGLIFIAAGLLSHAIHEFIEVGVITVGTQTAFDISGILSHEDGIGQFLRALFGYTATPEVITLVAWATYIVVVLALFLRPVRRPPAPVAATSQPVRP
jgi:high-affinity iron transporter